MKAADGGRKPRYLGAQRLAVPAIGFGCMALSGMYGTPDERGSLRVLDRALELGCIFLDTSDAYGPFTNEQLLGRALTGRRDQVVLATKFGNMRAADGSFSRGVNGKPDYVKSCCDASLKRLNVEVIDLDYSIALTRIPRSRKLLAPWLSLSRRARSATLACQKQRLKPSDVHTTYPISALQTEYSLWSREPEETILPTCASLASGSCPIHPLVAVS